MAHQHNNDVLLAWLTSALFRPCARPASFRSIFALSRHSAPAASPSVAAGRSPPLPLGAIATTTSTKKQQKWHTKKGVGGGGEAKAGTPPEGVGRIAHTQKKGGREGNKKPINIAIYQSVVVPSLPPSACGGLHPLYLARAVPGIRPVPKMGFLSLPLLPDTYVHNFRRPLSVVPSVLARTQTRHALAKTRGAKRGQAATEIHQTLMNNARTRRRGRHRNGHGWVRPTDNSKMIGLVACACAGAIMDGGAAPKKT
ncbi:hypothetical protein niasHT_037862 [Heterodera trifolii]|uniref:Uncharacterized protein n=1 Tax=Heterodera trifolii TaxID=157864 RepID=A0ABD2IQA9_9BILA